LPTICPSSREKVWEERDGRREGRGGKERYSLPSVLKRATKGRKEREWGSIRARGEKKEKNRVANLH